MLKTYLIVIFLTFFSLDVASCSWGNVFEKSICDIESYRDGLIISSKEGLVVFNGKSAKPLFKSSLKFAVTLCNVEVDKNGNVWFIAADEYFSKNHDYLEHPSIYVYDGKKITKVYSLKGVTWGSKVFTLDGLNHLWVMEMGSLLHYDGRKWTSYNMGSVMENSKFYKADIAVDRRYNVWIATSKGLVKFIDKSKIGTWTGIPGFILKSPFRVRNEDGLWEFYSKANGLSGERVNCVEVDSHNNIWAGTDDGLNKSNGKKWKVFKHKFESKSNSYVSRIAIDSEDNVWFVTFGGFYKINKGNPDDFILYKLPVEHYFDFDVPLSVDKKSHVWFGTREFGLVKFEAGRYMSHGKLLPL